MSTHLKSRDTDRRGVWTNEDLVIELFAYSERPVVSSAACGGSWGRRRWHWRWNDWSRRWRGRRRRFDHLRAGQLCAQITAVDSRGCQNRNVPFVVAEIDLYLSQRRVTADANFSDDCVESSDTSVD